jgi:hypothetical protein
MEDEELQIRDELSVICLNITEECSLMFDFNIDSFLAPSRGNTSVTTVGVYPVDSAQGNDDFWDKVGQIVGNLMELRMIVIHFLPYHNNGGDEDRIPAWEILTRILPYLRRKISLFFPEEDFDAGVEEIQGLARAIHGHPMISKFDFPAGFTFANLGPWCSALATLPSLERAVFGLQEPETEEQRILLNVEPLKELLRSPALRSVRFIAFYFTNELCYAMTNALAEGSSITDIVFNSSCSFPDGGGAIIAKALKTNASVTNVEFSSYCDEPLCDTLAAVLLCNSTLQNLTMRLPEENASGRWLSSIFLSLGMNTTLVSLSVGICDNFGDELCAAIKKGLAKNSTLEKLSLYTIFSSDVDGALSARNALSFLRINSTLKSLAVNFAPTQNKSHVSAFRLEAVKMLENTFLESLTITDNSGRSIKIEELLALISALQLNTTLKTLGFQHYCFQDVDYFTDDEVNQLVSVLMKNFGLEHVVPDIPCIDDRTIRAILRLNGAGRRYLIKDGSSISKGVKVLSAISDEIDCVFIHLLENPSLCDRRAAETTPGSRQPSANLDESSSTGKRERALSLSSKEPRRRLA